MDKEFGKHTIDELVEAQRVTHDVIEFIRENRKSENKALADSAERALFCIAMDQMFVSASMKPLINEMAEEYGVKQEKPQSFSIPIPTGEQS